jgi:tetratricopeptide (TPR) repeat protein
MRLLIAILLTNIFLLDCKQKEVVKNQSSTNDTVFDALSEKIEKNPKDAELRFLRAKYLNESNRLDEAIIDMREAILIDSTQSRYYHLLSDLFMDINNSSKALMTMRKAGQLFADSVITQLKLSETLLILKEYQEAIVVLNRVIGKNPQNAEAYFMLGLVFRETGEESKAINSLQTATEMDAKLTDAWILLGNIWEPKKPDLAERYYKTATEVSPQNISALHSYAFFLQNNGKIEEALELYRRINLINPKYPDAYLNAGILYLEQKNTESALEQFNILTKIAQTDPRGFFFKGLTFYQTNRIDDARRELQNALNLDPEYAQAKELMDEISY